MLKGRRKADSAVRKPPRRLCQGCDSEPSGANVSLGSQECLCDLGQQTRLLPCEHGRLALPMGSSEQGRGRHGSDPHCPTPRLPQPPLTQASGFTQSSSCCLQPGATVYDADWPECAWLGLSCLLKRSLGRGTTWEKDRGYLHELVLEQSWPVGHFVLALKRVSAVLLPCWFFMAFLYFPYLFFFSNFYLFFSRP